MTELLLFLILNPLTVKTKFQADSNRGPYKLPDRFILLLSDSLWIGDSLLCREEYIVDYNRGEITFKEPIPDNLEITVKYERVPFPLKERYYHKEEMFLEKGESFPVPEPESSRIEEAELFARGSKSISAGIGNNQTLSLEQSLRLELRGTLAGMDIDGRLSDQSTPIPPEGITREIQELDRILINLKSKNFRGSVGDIDFEFPFRGFGAVTRRAEGGMGEVSFSNLRLKAGIARTKGRYEHRSFLGEDGKQGPYKLEESVVPASEEVYLDGELLIRGFDNDYTIDYSTGEIYFTNKNIINSRSRIEIDFQYYTEGYERDDYGIEGEYRMGPLTIGFDSYSEGENPVEMSSSDKDYLSKIGDDTTKAWVSGVSYVGDNKGDYIKEDNHFLFVGDNKGDYKIRFSYMGKGEGDYIYDNDLSAFVWVGEKKGRYSPVIYLRPPQRSSALLSRVGIDYYGLKIDVDGIASENDKNIYASTDDRDNRGLGYRIISSYYSKRFDLSYTRRFMDKSLFLPAREREVDFKYRWGIEPPEEEIRDEIQVGFNPFSSLKFTADIGRLGKRERWEIGGQFKNSEYRFFSLPNTKRHQLSFENPVGIFTPRLLFFREDSDTNRFWEVTTGMELKGFNLSYTQREEKSYDSKWLRRSNTYIPQIGIDTKLYNNLSLEGILGYQRKRFIEVEGNDLSHYFITARGWYNHPKGISLSLFGESTHRMDQLKEIEYVRVEKGKGDYSRNPETGEFYPDTLGEYIRKVVPSGEPLPSQRLEVRGGMDLSPFRLIGFQGSYRKVLETSDTLYLNYDNYINTSVNILPYEATVSFALGQDYGFYKENLAYEIREEKNSTYYMGLRSNYFSHLLLRGRLEYSHHDRKISMPEYIEDEKKAELESTFLLNWNPTLRINYSRKEIEEPLYYPEIGRFLLDCWGMGVGLRGSYKEEGLLSLSFDLAYRNSDIDNLPFDIRMGEPLGLTPTAFANFEYYLSSDLIFSLQYTFEDRPDKTPQHTLNSGLRLYF